MMSINEDLKRYKKPRMKIDAIEGCSESIHYNSETFVMRFT